MEKSSLNYKEVIDKYHLIPRQEELEEVLLLSVLLVKKKNEDKGYDVQVRTSSQNSNYVPQDFINLLCNQVGHIVVELLNELRKQTEENNEILNK